MSLKNELWIEIICGEFKQTLIEMSYFDQFLLTIKVSAFLGCTTLGIPTFGINIIGIMDGWHNER